MTAFVKCTMCFASGLVPKATATCRALKPCLDFNELPAHVIMISLQIINVPIRLIDPDVRLVKADYKFLDVFDQFRQLVA